MKQINENSKALVVASLAAFATLYSGVASAATIGQLAINAIQSLTGLTQFAGALGYTMGIIIAVVATFKLKDYRDDPRQTPLGTPLFYYFVAIMLVYLTTTIETAKDSTLGAGAQTQGAQGQMNIR